MFAGANRIHAGVAISVSWKIEAFTQHSSAWKVEKTPWRKYHNNTKTRPIPLPNGIRLRHWNYISTNYIAQKGYLRTKLTKWLETLGYFGNLGLHMNILLSLIKMFSAILIMHMFIWNRVIHSKSMLLQRNIIHGPHYVRILFMFF